ncbi:MAG: hypothetical protein KJZ62_05220 [Fimbriimonadaceae bacterium]|nr:hypothetical protein [Fimbriimonadaceae bacterium]MCL4284482.1 hypothetical protein [Fimbriimonadaceae bacterium]QOJ12146.1 MAG: hypothetical protein HRU74_08830 [Chthonomonadaceae bacterium]
MTLSSAITASLLALSMGAMTLEPQGKTAPGSAKTKAPDVIVTGPIKQVDDPALARRVTNRFEGAPISEVLDWLASENVSFVADSEAFGDRKLTANFVNQPLKDVIAAIASALDGQWTRNGSVYSLKLKFDFLELGPSGRDFTFVGPDVFKMGDKNLLSEESLKEMQKAMEEAHKAIKERIDVRVLDKEIVEKLRSEKSLDRAEELLKELKTLPKFEGDFIIPDLVLPKIGGGDAMILNLSKVEKLLSTLTAEQKTTMEKNGHLKYSELTQAQKEILGKVPTGNWSIVFEGQGKRLAIKSG